jgi:hypothetical protein
MDTPAVTQSRNPAGNTGEQGGGVAVYDQGQRSVLWRTGRFDDLALRAELPALVTKCANGNSSLCFGDIGTGDANLAAENFSAIHSSGRKCERTVLSDPNADHRQKIVTHPVFAPMIAEGAASVLELDLMEEFPAEFGEFRMLTCISVLMHIPKCSIEQVIRRMVQSIRVNGVLIVGTKNPIVAKHCYTPVGEMLFEIPGSRDSVVETYRSLEHYATLFRAAGAEVMHTTSIPITADYGKAVPKDYLEIVGQPLWDLLVVTRKS